MCVCLSVSVSLWSYYITSCGNRQRIESNNRETKSVRVKKRLLRAGYTSGWKLEERIGNERKLTQEK